MTKYLSKYFVIFVNVSIVVVMNFQSTSALLISEIQFDPTGADTDREWIEVFNETNNNLDLTTHILFEGNSNHGISVLQGDKELASGEYAILTSDLEKFKIDYPTYSGKIFKVSFTSGLSNSGESLILKDSKDGNILHSHTYSPGATGAGNGSTISFDGTNFLKSTATPGTGSLTIGISVQGTTDTNNVNTNNGSSTSSSTATSYVAPVYYYRSYWPESEKIYLHIGENKNAIAGAQIPFSANLVTGDKKHVSNATVFWSFGDGEEAQGKDVLHTFKYPGEYVVNAEGYSDGRKIEDKIYVKITEGNFKINYKEYKGEKVVELSNLSKEEVNVSEFLIKAEGGEFEKVFTLPKRMSILPNKSVTFSQVLLKFATDTRTVSLLYPNQKLVVGYELPIDKVAKLIEQKEKDEVATTTKILGVMTKEEFEKTKLNESKNITINVVPRNKVIKESLENVSVKKSEKITEGDEEGGEAKVEKENVGNFVVKNEGPGFLTTLFKYFGI